MIDHPMEQQLGELQRLWTEAFGEEPFWNTFLSGPFRRENCRCVTVDGALAAALYFFDCNMEGRKMAYLYGVATGEKYRNRGLCRTLLEDTHAFLKTRDYCAALLVPAGEELRRMYRKMGYEDCGAVREFSCGAGEKTLPLRPVTPEEYGRLRKELLPDGAVIQEGDNLTHLGNMAELYAGADFLISGYRMGTTLHVLEYLGSESLAPAIVKTLGCSRGDFRISGGEKPFAMICPLTADAPAPFYFGLAFE